MVKLAIREEGEVRVVNDQVVQPTSGMDLAKQLVELGISNSPAGVYHGTNGGSATWFEFAQTLFEMSGADARRVIPIDSDEFLRLAKRPNYSVLDHSEWTKTSITEMRNWKEALAESFPKIFEKVVEEGGKNA